MAFSRLDWSGESGLEQLGDTAWTRGTFCGHAVWIDTYIDTGRFLFLSPYMKTMR